MNLDLACVTAQVSKRSLYNWMAAGKLPYTRTNRTRHVRIEDVLQLAKKTQQEAANGESESDV